MRTLVFAVRQLLLKPNTARKLTAFVFVLIVFYIFSYILSDLCKENAMLSGALGFLWIPLSLLYLVLRHGAIFKRRRFKKFFLQAELVAYDGSLPTFCEEADCGQYIKRLRFKSKIPVCEWERKIPTLEMFFNRKIYKIQNSKEDIKNMDILLIEENLPNSILWDDKNMLDGRKFAIGESYEGKAAWNLARLPHGIVAGATGGGKTSLLRCIIHQALIKQFNVNVLDFKQGGDYSESEREYLKFNDLERGYGSFVISEPEAARDLLISLLVEVRGRLECFKQAGVTDVDEFNARGKEQFLPWLIVFDEAAEILDVKPKDKVEKDLYTEIEQTLRTLTRISRAAGVHILLGIIRPSSDIIDGQIKNNCLWRACGYFADSAASRIVLENDRATELPPEIKGRFIIGQDEVQAYYLPIPAVERTNSD